MRETLLVAGAVLTIFLGRCALQRPRKPMFIIAFAASFAAWIEWVRLMASSTSVDLLPPWTQTLVDHLNIVPAFLATMLPSARHDVSLAETIYWVLVYVQWLLVGICLCWGFARFIAYRRRTVDSVE